MKLLLDEMISPRIARQLREQGFDVEAIKKDRPDLEALADREILQHLAGENRAVVTNDVLDFQLLHNQIARAGQSHAGIIFTNDFDLPGNKQSIDLWIKTLGDLLRKNPQEAPFRNRAYYL